jgi:hypothetical protein
MKNLLLIALAAACLGGCFASGGPGVATARGGGQSLTASPTLPASEGSVKFGVAKNDNTSIALTVKHLPHPDKLTPPASVYVVWTRAKKDAPPQNIGALTVDKNLTGTLNTVSPLHAFDLLITAEASGQVLAPSGRDLLWTSYSR